MPAVVVGTDAFRALADTIAASLGLPHLPVVTVAHPIGGLDPDVVRGRAESVVDHVLAALTQTPTAGAGSRAGAAPASLTAPLDIDEFQTFALAEGWGDGLPVLPPTAERVARILGAWTPRRDEIVARLAPRAGVATVETIAVNAALAGAGPEHLPVIVAAVRAVAEPRFNLHGILPTTHPCTPLVIVNGPIARRLEINGGANALGQGHRANAVIGRAVRLVMQNVAGATPGKGDRATHGHPGKYSYCVAENEAESPWTPLHVDRGFRADESCVTVCASEAPHNVNDHGSTSAASLLKAIAGTAATPGSNNIYLGGEPLVILGPEHAATIAASGWSKRDFQRAFWEAARVPLARLAPENVARFAVIDPARFGNAAPTSELALCSSPDDVMVIVAGGPGKHSAIVPTFGHTRSVSIAVES